MSWWRPLRRFLREVFDPPAPQPGSDSPVVDPSQTRPDVRVAAHVSAAREALLKGNLDGCAEAAHDALLLNARDVLALFYLGQARVRQERLEEARAIFRAAVDAGDPFGLASGWLHRVERLLAAAPSPFPTRDASDAIELERAARAALRHHDFARARALADEAVHIDPTNLLAHHYLGQALLGLGQEAAAVAAFEAARPYQRGLNLVDGWIAGALEGRAPWLDELPAEEADDDAE